jgi:hypothetical protein
MLRVALVALAVGALSAGPATARESGDPIKLAWTEGDVAGMMRILSPDGKTTVGFVEYRQRVRGNELSTMRIARFADGSSDEDEADARVGPTLEALRGRSIIRDTQGRTTVDLSIDVAGGRITGFSGLGSERESYDEHVRLPPGTYWGALIFIVLKNFDQNADDDRLVFHTVAPTPKPRSIDLELTREGPTTLEQPGNVLEVTRYTLRPTINWLIDPIVQRIAPSTEFLVFPGAPPALARFIGPVNYTGQEMWLE